MHTQLSVCACALICVSWVYAEKVSCSHTHMYLKECDHTSSTVLSVLLTAFTPLVISCHWTLIRSLLTNEECFPNKTACRLSTPSRRTSISSAFQFSFFAFVDILKVCKLFYTAFVRQHVIWHMIFCGPVLRYGNKYDVFCETQLYHRANNLRCFDETDVRTSQKTTYAQFKIYRTNFTDEIGPRTAV